MSGKNRLANGAKSPDAPNEPLSYTIGNISLLKKSSIRLTVATCTPLYPNDKA